MSTIAIGAFTATISFGFEDLTPEENGVQHINPYDGTMRVYLNYQKDRFAVSFKNLTDAEMFSIKQIIRATGTGALHVVRYTRDDGVIRLYDGSTAPTSLINADVNRVRGMVRIMPAAAPHWPQKVDAHSMTLDCWEA
jgi:hypothetical protein